MAGSFDKGLRGTVEGHNRVARGEDPLLRRVELECVGRNVRVGKDRP